TELINGLDSCLRRNDKTFSHKLLRGYDKTFSHKLLCGNDKSGLKFFTHVLIIAAFFSLDTHVGELL
ncbi:MAG: hypothetical protein RBS43_09720, partial [Candidatus Cloacimonas sp.]|nr:hypothetical protein [Candidatus Cloacimonas sp.]